MPSPVALAILSLFRRSRRAASGPAEASATRPLAVVVGLVAVAGIGLYLLGREQEDAPPGPISGPIADLPPESPATSSPASEPARNPPFGVDSGPIADSAADSAADLAAGPVGDSSDPDRMVVSEPARGTSSDESDEAGEVAASSGGEAVPGPNGQADEMADSIDRETVPGPDGRTDEVTEVAGSSDRGAFPEPDDRTGEADEIADSGDREAVPGPDGRTDEVTGSSDRGDFPGPDDRPDDIATAATASSREVTDPAERAATPVPGPGPSVDATGVVPLERHERLVREKEELEARVAALEAETTELESEMLALDLQVLVLETATLDEDADPEAVGGAAGREPGTGVSSPPIELGNATLVPPPLTEIAGAGIRDAPVWQEPVPGRGGEPDERLDPFLPDATLDSLLDTASYEDTMTESTYAGTLPPSANTWTPDSGSARARASTEAGAPIERVVITEVPVGSSAADAGILPGDVLLAVDGRPVVSLDDLYPYVNGDPAPLHELELLRGDRRQWVDLADSPADLSLGMRRIDSARLVSD